MKTQSVYLVFHDPRYAQPNFLAAHHCDLSWLIFLMSATTGGTEPQARINFISLSLSLEQKDRSFQGIRGTSIVNNNCPSHDNACCVPLSRIPNDITVRALYFFNWVTREKATETSLKLLCYGFSFSSSFFFFFFSYRTTAIHVCHWLVGKRLDSLDRSIYRVRPELFVQQWCI